MERAWEVTPGDGLLSQESRGRERRRGHGRLPQVMDYFLKKAEGEKDGEGMGGYHM
jgi:hypothetical protein